MTDFKFGVGSDPSKSPLNADGTPNWAVVGKSLGKNFQPLTAEGVSAENPDVPMDLIKQYVQQRNDEQKPFVDALDKYNAGDASVTPEKLTQLYKSVGDKSAATASTVEKSRQDAFTAKMEAGNSFGSVVKKALTGAALIGGGLYLAGAGAGDVLGTTAAHTGMAAGEVAASSGLSDATMQSIMQSALTGAEKNAAINAVAQLVKTGKIDVGSVAKAAAKGTLGNLIGQAVGAVVPQSGVLSIDKAVKSGLTAGILSGDAKTGLIGGAMSLGSSALDSASKAVDLQGNVKSATSALGLDSAAKSISDAAQAIKDASGLTDAEKATGIKLLGTGIDPSAIITNGITGEIKSTIAAALAGGATAALTGGAKQPAGATPMAQAQPPQQNAATLDAMQPQKTAQSVLQPKPQQPQTVAASQFTVPQPAPIQGAYPALNALTGVQNG